MSQPQLTKFFANAKRGTRANAKSSKLLLDSAETTPKKSTRSVKAKEVTELKVVEALEPTKVNVKPAKKVVEKDAEANEIVKEPVEKENKNDEATCPSPVKRSRRVSRSEEATKEVKEVPKETKATVKRAPSLKRSTSRALEDVSEIPASPSKKSRSGRSKDVQDAIQVSSCFCS